MEIFWPIFGPPGPPRGPKMGPGTPGIDLKSKKKNQKFGPEVSTIFEILIFGFLGVFSMEIRFVSNFSLFFTPGGALGPPGKVKVWLNSRQRPQSGLQGSL